MCDGDVTLEVADGLGVAEEAEVVGVGGAEGAEERAEAAQAQEGEPRGRVAEAAPQRQGQVAVHAPPLGRRRPPPLLRLRHRPRGRWWLAGSPRAVPGYASVRGARRQSR